MPKPKSKLLLQCEAIWRATFQRPDADQYMKRQARAVREFAKANDAKKAKAAARRLQRYIVRESRHSSRRERGIPEDAMSCAGVNWTHPEASDALRRWMRTDPTPIKHMAKAIHVSEMSLRHALLDDTERGYEMPLSYKEYETYVMMSKSPRLKRMFRARQFGKAKVIADKLGRSPFDIPKPTLTKDELMEVRKEFDWLRLPQYKQKQTYHPTHNPVPEIDPCK